MNPTRLLMTTMLAASLVITGYADPIPDRPHAKLNQLVGTWRIETMIGDELVTESATIKWNANSNTVLYQGIG